MDKVKPYPVFLILMIVGILASCVTLQDHTLPPQEKSSVEVIGRVSTSFITIQPLHIPFYSNISLRAYSRLMEEARKKYHGNIEVVNITAYGTFNALTLIPLPPTILGIFSNFQTIQASGEVVLNSGTIFSEVSQKTIANVVKDLSEIITKNISENSAIAVLSVFSTNKNISEYIIGELEYNFVNFNKYKIVDRRRLDQIRNEQNFQMSGDVSDSSAVTIGNMLGANIVITGEISEIGSNKVLTLRALDVKTAQIITIARKEL